MGYRLGGGFAADSPAHQSVDVLNLVEGMNSLRLFGLRPPPTVEIVGLLGDVRCFFIDSAEIGLQLSHDAIDVFQLGSSPAVPPGPQVPSMRFGRWKHVL